MPSQQRDFSQKKTGISRALSPCPARHPSPALASGPGCISPSNREESHGVCRSDTRSNTRSNAWETQWGTVINDASTPCRNQCEPPQVFIREMGLLGKQGSQLQHSTQQRWAVPEQGSARWKNTARFFSLKTIKTKRTRPVGNEIDRMRCSQSCHEKIRRCSHKFCNRESMLITPLSTAQWKNTGTFAKTFQGQQQLPHPRKLYIFMYIYIYNI